MDQIQRDLTYRKEALQSICNEYGYESKKCQQSIEIWERQHSANFLTSQTSAILFVTVFIIIAYFLFLVVLPKILILILQKKKD